MISFRSKPVGWRQDSHRHYLAAKYGSAKQFDELDKSGERRRANEAERKANQRIAFLKATSPKVHAVLHKGSVTSSFDGTYNELKSLEDDGWVVGWKKDEENDEEREGYFAKQQIIAMRGFPASGKTTWAKEYVKRHPDFVVVERDDNGGVRITKIKSALKSGKSVVSSDTNLYKRDVDELRRLGKPFGAKVTVKSFMHVPIEESIRRDAARKKPVGAYVIKIHAGKLREAKK